MNSKPIGRIEEKRTYLTLDGLRGVAALGVVSLHLAFLLGRVRLPSAYLAVDLFFVMSGFVLAHSYDDRLGANLSTASFMRKRLVRLYPLYLLSVLIVALGILFTLAMGDPTEWTWRAIAISIGTSLAFLPTPPGLVGHNLYPLNFPAWSLFLELLVNLLYALVRPWLGGRTLLVTLLVSGILLLGTIMLAGSANLGPDWASLALSPPRVIFSFFLGIGIYRAERAERLPKVRMPAWATLLLLLLIITVPVPPQLRIFYDSLAIFAVLPLLVVAGVQNQPARLRHAYTFLGLTSFPVYILHVPLMKYMEAVILRLLGSSLQDYIPIAGFGLLAVSLPISWIAARYVDLPARRIFGFVLGRVLALAPKRA